MVSGTQICPIGTYASIRFAGAKNTHYARGYRVIFYFTSDYSVYYRSSSDGSTWSDAQSATDATLSYVYCLASAYDEANYRFHLFWIPDSGYLRYRSGTMGTNGVITWDSIVNVNTATNNDKISAAVDSSGHPIVTYTNGTYPYVAKSTTTNSNSAWSNASTFPYQLSATSSTWWACVRAGSNNKFYVGYSYNNAANVFGRMFNSSMGSEEAVGGNIAYGYSYDLCFDPDDNVWLITYYNSTSTANARIYKRSFISGAWNTGQYWAVHQVSGSTFGPQILWQNGKLYVFSLEWTASTDTAGYYSLDGSVIDAQPTWISESTATIYNSYGIAPFAIGNDKIGVAYPTYPSSVYTLTYAELTTTAGSSGPKWYEDWQSWTPTATTWTEKDMTTLGVPKGAVCAIIMTNGNNAVDVTMGVRSYGSSIDRTLNLHEAEGGGVVCMMMYVKTDETYGKIQYAATSTTLTNFYLVGYWTGTDFTEDMTILSTDTISAWTDYNLNSSVGANKVAQFALVNAAIDSSVNVGVRTKGSTNDTRYFALHEAEGSGGCVDGLSICAKTDGSGYIQYYTTYLTSGYVILLGHFNSTMDYTELNPTTVDITAYGTWQDFDFSSSLDQDGRTCECVHLNGNTAAEYLEGSRAKRSYAARYLTVHEAESNGKTGFTCPTSTDAQGIMQMATGQYADDLNGIIGYFIPLVTTITARPFVQCVFVG